LQNTTAGFSFETNDNEDINGVMDDLDELRSRLEHKKKQLLEKEWRLRQEHENVEYEHLQIFTVVVN